MSDVHELLVLNTLDKRRLADDESSHKTATSLAVSCIIEKLGENYRDISEAIAGGHPF